MMGFAPDLRGLAAVTIGTSLREPAMHRVTPNHFQGGVLAFAKLREKGFRRIGLVLSPAMHERVEGKWLGAYLVCLERLPAGDRLTPLLAAQEDYEALAAWRRRERPDAVLVAEEFVWGPPSRTQPDDSRRPAPGWLMWPGNLRGLGGIDYRFEQLGRVAVEAVVAQIHRNERGSPAIPQTVMIDGVWVDA